MCRCHVNMNKYKQAFKIVEDLVIVVKFYLSKPRKKVLLYAILTQEMKNSNLFLLSKRYCENFKTSFVYDLVNDEVIDETSFEVFAVVC